MTISIPTFETTSALQNDIDHIVDLAAAQSKNPLAKLARPFSRRRHGAPVKVIATANGVRFGQVHDCVSGLTWSKEKRFEVLSGENTWDQFVVWLDDRTEATVRKSIRTLLTAFEKGLAGDELAGASFH